MKYYTSDLHLSHENIIAYENRPFNIRGAAAQKRRNKWNNPVREWGLHFGLYIEIKKDGTKLKRDKDAKKLLKGETKIRKKRRLVG